jgi:hypothetical protein
VPLLIEASQTLLDRIRVRLDVEGVLGDLPGDARHFYRTPHKYVPVVLGEVDGLAFLFGV